MNNLTKTFAGAWTPHGVRVNCIAVGAVASEGFLRAMDRAGLDPDEVGGTSNAVGRAGRPDEIAYGDPVPRLRRGQLPVGRDHLHRRRPRSAATDLNMDRGRVQALRDGLPPRLNAGILMGDGGFCILGWALFTVGFHPITMYANTLAVVDLERGGPAIDVVAREYELAREPTSLRSRAQRRDTERRRASTRCGPVSTRCWRTDGSQAQTVGADRERRYTGDRAPEVEAA